MVQRKITDYMTFDAPPRNIRINGSLPGSHFILHDTGFYLESKYDPVMITCKDENAFVLCCLNLETCQEVTIYYYQDVCRSPDVVWKIIREIQTIPQLNHTSILQIESIGIPISSESEKENREKVMTRLFSDVYVVYKSDGLDNLHNILSTGQSIFNLSKLVYQVLNTLKYLHGSAGILHHSLRAKDIFISADHQSIKLFGFGASHLIGEGGDTCEMKESSADPRKQLCCLAPEEIMMIRECTNKTSIDVWYLGCLLAEILLFGDSPFLIPESMDKPTKELQLEQVLAALRPEVSEFGFINCQRCKADILRRYETLDNRGKPTLLDKISHARPWEIDLVKNMLAFDPSNRCSIEQAVNFIVGNGESIEEEEEKQSNCESMEEERDINSESMEEEDYLRLSEDVGCCNERVVGYCDEQTLREIVWAQMTRFHQSS